MYVGIRVQYRLLFSYFSDEQTTARGPDAARLEVLSGPRQILNNSKEIFNFSVLKKFI